MEETSEVHHASQKEQMKEDIKKREEASEGLFYKPAAQREWE